MTDAYRTPGREVDETAVETAKIHEAAETQRALITEREKTKREALDNRDNAGYLLPRVVAGIVAVAAVIAIATTANTYIEAHSPKPISRPCVAWAEVLSHSDSNRTCAHGRLISQPVSGKDGEMFVRCICEIEIADAGASDQ